LVLSTFGNCLLTDHVETGQVTGGEVLVDEGQLESVVLIDEVNDKVFLREHLGGHKLLNLLR
jgi:hypothetical protein